MSTEHGAGDVTEPETNRHAGDVTERDTNRHGGDVTEHEAAQQRVVHLEKGGVFRTALRHLFWPLRIAGRAFHGFLRLLGFRTQTDGCPDADSESPPARQSLSGRKRLHPVTRLLLSVLPRWAQGALGYPVSSSIGLTLSPEVGTSPTKPCGKGSKRKQEELDDDEEEQQTWVEVLTQELPDKDNPEEDPDYEPSTIETESEEYRSHNDTESDLEVSTKGAVLVEDVGTNEPVPVPV